MSYAKELNNTSANSKRYKGLHVPHHTQNDTNDYTYRIILKGFCAHPWGKVHLVTCHPRDELPA